MAGDREEYHDQPNDTMHWIFAGDDHQCAEQRHCEKYPEQYLSNNHAL